VVQLKLDPRKLIGVVYVATTVAMIIAFVYVLYIGDLLLLVYPAAAFLAFLFLMGIFAQRIRNDSTKS
jgi:hypothetical protein